MGNNGKKPGKKSAETPVVRLKDFKGDLKPIIKRAPRIPAMLEGYGFRKASGDWGMTFSVTKESKKFSEPLQDHMMDEYIIVAIRVKSIQEAQALLSGNELDKLELDLHSLSVG